MTRHGCTNMLYCQNVGHKHVGDTFNYTSKHIVTRYHCKITSKVNSQVAISYEESRFDMELMKSLEKK